MRLCSPDIQGNWTTDPLWKSEHVKVKEIEGLETQPQKTTQEAELVKGRIRSSYNYQHKEKKISKERTKMLSIRKLLKTEQTDHLLMRSSLI